MAETLADRLRALRRFGVEDHLRLEVAERDRMAAEAQGLALDRADLLARLEVLLRAFDATTAAGRSGVAPAQALGATGRRTAHAGPPGRRRGGERLSGPKQATLDLRRRVVATAHGLPGDPRLAVLVRIPPPTDAQLRAQRNAKRRPAG